MKRCPACNRVESDDGLQFCRVDGTALVGDSGSVSGNAATARFGSAPVSSESQTSILPHTTDASMNRPTGPTTVLPAAQPPSLTVGLGRQKRRRFLIALVIVIALAIPAAVIISAASYY